MQYFPLFLDLHKKPVLVVGGGEVASRKVETLLKTGAQIQLVAPAITSFLHELVRQGQIEWLRQVYQDTVLNRDFIQVWATTNDSALNHQIYADAKRLGLLVNVVDDLPYCDFITPSIINRGRIQVAISSGGASPVLIRNLRESVESVLPGNLSLLAEFGSQKREQIKADLPDIKSRRCFWENFFADQIVKDATSFEPLEVRYQQLLQDPLPLIDEVIWVSYDDDIELIPIKALRFMQKADRVIHHRSLPPACLELCRRDAERLSWQDEEEFKLILAHEREKAQCLCILTSESENSVLELRQPGERLFCAAIVRHH